MSESNGSDLPPGQATAMDRTKRRVLIGTVVASTAIGGMIGGMTMPLVPLFFLSRGLTIVEMGWASAMIALSAVVFQLVARRYYDRLSTVRALGWVSAAPGLMLPGFLAMRLPWHLVLLALFMTSFSAIAAPAAQARALSIARSMGPTRVLGRMGMVSSFAFAAGIMLGALLLTVGWDAVFWTGAVLAASSAGGIHVAAMFTRSSVQSAHRGELLPPPVDRMKASAAMFATGLSEATRRLQNHGRRQLGLQERRVRRLTVHIVLFQGAFAMFPFFIPLFFQSHGISYAHAAAIVAVGWMVYAPLQALAPRFEALFPPASTAAGIAVLALAGFLCLMAMGDLWVAAIAWLIMAACDGVGRPVRDALVVASRRGASAYTSLAWLDSAGRIARVISPLTFVAMVTVWGFSGGLLFSAVLLSLSAIPLLLPGAWATSAPASSPDADVSSGRPSGAMNRQGAMD